MAVWCDHPLTNLLAVVCPNLFPWNDCAGAEMGEVLLLPEVTIVELLTTRASPKRALFFQETEFVFLKASLFYLGTIVAVVSFYLVTFYANLFCRETFLVGFGALMIETWVAMELEEICFPSNLAICYAHLLTFVVDKGLDFDFVPGNDRKATSASDGSCLPSDSLPCLPAASHLSSLLPPFVADRLAVFSVRLQAAANRAVPDQR